MRACAREHRRRPDARPRRAPFSHANVNSTQHATCKTQLAECKSQHATRTRRMRRRSGGRRSARLCAQACVALPGAAAAPSAANKTASGPACPTRSAPPQPCRARRGGAAAANHGRKQNLRTHTHPHTRAHTHARTPPPPTHPPWQRRGLDGVPRDGGPPRRRRVRRCGGAVGPSRFGEGHRGGWGWLARRDCRSHLKQLWR
jgi:hypothetical protein